MTPERPSLAARVWPVAYDAALAVAKAAVGARITVIDEGGAALLHGETPIIMAANHQGHLDYDTLLLATPLPRRRHLRYVSSELLLNRLGRGKGVSSRIQRRVLSGMFTYVHRVIPVGETVRGEQAVEAMVGALSQGDTVVIFPEGERNTDRGLSPLPRGVAAASVDSGAPILPIRIDGTRNATSPRGLPTRSKPRITVRLREPITVAPDDSADLLLARVAQSLQTPGAPLRRSALLIGTPASHAWNLPRLLSRCGFDVDVISTPTPLFRTRRHIRTLTTRATPDSVLRTALEHTAVTDYDWVVPVNDDFLALLRTRTDIPEADRLRLAPVQSADSLRILSSKIGVCLALEQAGLPTPDFAVVHNVHEAESAAQRIGYPAMLKQDTGHSGVGVTEVHTHEALRKAMTETAASPMLLQAKVPGDVIDLSGVFREGVLVHATYSVETQRLGDFGPSSLREYRSLSTLSAVARRDLVRLGSALHLNGFTSITAIDTPAAGLTFIEVDVRPNAWVAHGRSVGDDPEVRLQAHALGSSACTPTGIPAGPHLIGNPLRRPRREVLLGRHRMWRTFPVDSPDAWILAVRALLKGPIGPEVPTP
jgi:1-acyl-sn-glycerol-3-phosphate acyltransferase